MLLFVILISTIFYFLGRRKSTATKIKEKEFTLFDSTAIRGRVVAIGSTLDISFFKVDNNAHQFLFDPNISEEGSFFNANTEKGDSIIKPAFGHLLQIKSKDKTYTYTFKKEWE